MGEGKARLSQHLPGLLQRQFQSHGKGHGGELGGFIVDIRADLGEQLAVDVGPFVTLCVSHAPLVDLPQQHLRKALIQFAEGLVQTGGRHGTGGRHTLRFLHGHGGHSHPAALGLPAVGVGIHIAVIDVRGNVGKEFSADGVGSPVKDHQIHRHVVGQKEVPDGIHGHLQGLVLGIAVHPGGDQGERQGFTLIGQGHFQRGAVCRDQQFPLPVAATLPDGTDGVNDKLCR